MTNSASSNPGAVPVAAESTGLISRLRDPKRWKKSIVDVVLWFMFGWLVTTMFSLYSPGYPVIVGTPSIPVGLYWVDKTDHSFHRGDYVSFDFQPQQDWLKGRYGKDLVHTKIILGLPGDVVRADKDLNLTICHIVANDKPAACASAGKVFTADSKGRPLYSWVPAEHSYVVQPGELWVFGTHPRSLDSRYHGPVRAADMNGKATPLVQF